MALPVTQDLLIKLAGEPAYQRGKQVYKNGQVVRWQKQGNKVSAVVEGSYRYDVILILNDRTLDGHCSCPASDNFDFCKHCVAVALTVTENQQPNTSDNDQLARYFRSLSKEVLVEHLQKMIELDPALTKYWSLKAHMAMETMDSKAIKKQITRALPYRQMWDYHKVNHYFSHAESIFDLLIEPLTSLPAAEAFRLAEYGFERLNRALEKIDDSHGFRFGVEESLGRLLLESFAKLDWSREKRVAFLVKQLSEAKDVYPKIPEDFIGDNDHALSTLFIQQCETQWQTLLANTRDKEAIRFHPLNYTLLADARNHSDVAREIEILSQTAHSNLDYLKLADCHLKQKAYDEAERCLDKVESKKFGHHLRDYLEKRIHIDIVRGNYKAALDQQWELFVQHPGDGYYKELKMLHAENGLNETDCYQRVETYLQALAEQKDHYRGRVPNEELVNFYLYTGSTKKGVEYAKKHPINRYQLMELAKTILAKEPQTAIDFFKRSVSAIAGQANNQAYKEAVDALQELREMLARLDDRQWLTAFADLIVELKANRTLARKKNFMALIAQFT